MVLFWDGIFSPGSVFIQTAPVSEIRRRPGICAINTQKSGILIGGRLLWYVEDGSGSTRIRNTWHLPGTSPAGSSKASTIIHQDVSNSVSAEIYQLTPVHTCTISRFLGYWSRNQAELEFESSQCANTGYMLLTEIQDFRPNLQYEAFKDCGTF